MQAQNNLLSYLTNPQVCDEKPELWIRIDLMRIRIRIQIQNVDDQKLEKIQDGNFVNIFF